MDDLTVIFEEKRTHLRPVAYRLLGPVYEADDAVQKTWLRLEPSDVSDVHNLPRLAHHRGLADLFRPAALEPLGGRISARSRPAYPTTW